MHGFCQVNYISQIDEILTKFFGNLRIYFAQFLGSIVNNTERIKTREINTINI